MYDEQVKALRCCGSMIIDCKKHCPYYGKENCSARKDADAADAIEAAEAKIVKLNTKCADLQSQIYEMENEIEELLPKEGEWIIKPHGTYGQLRAFCSACGKHSGIGGIVSNQKKPYCPNCGARMRGDSNGNAV